MTQHGATQALAEFAHSVDVGAGPASLRRYAVRAVIDTVAVALAARDEAALRLVYDTLPPQGSGPSSVWGSWEHSTPDHAALLNGTAAHALDYDDVAEAVHTHPSAVMVPALLAVAEASGASGQEILDAYVVGYEVQVAIGAGMDLEAHFGRGWHGTTSIAVLGGAAAVARLMRLDVEATRNAIAMAGSMAGGSRQNFGTMTKPFHAGMAARDSVLCAQLAAAGLTADATQIEGPVGYLTNFGDGPTGASGVVETIEQPWSLLRTPLNIKPYPCCYRASRTADAAIQLHERGIDPAAVEHVLLTLERRGLAPLIHHRPANGLEGKFSGEYVFAAGLCDGAVALSSFTDDAVNRSDLQQLLRKVEVAESEQPPFGPPEWAGGYAAVEVRLNDGRTEQIRVDTPHGHDDDPLTDDELREKLLDCVRFGGSTLDVDALLTRLHSLDSDEPYAGLVEQVMPEGIGSHGRHR